MLNFGHVRKVKIMDLSDVVMGEITREKRGKEGVKLAKGEEL